MRHFSITFGPHYDKSNHLPTTDLKIPNHLASSEFRRNCTEKTRPMTLTVFLIKPFVNFPRTDTRFGIISIDIEHLHLFAFENSNF